MRDRWLISLLVTSMALTAGCAADAGDELDDADWLDGKADGSTAVNVAATNLDVDLAAKTAVA
ncbi:MAG: hypothetical protein ABI175_12190, partial [Polyangiales bacterium]